MGAGLHPATDNAWHFILWYSSGHFGSSLIKKSLGLVDCTNLHGQHKAPYSSAFDRCFPLGIQTPPNRSFIILRLGGVIVRFNRICSDGLQIKTSMASNLHISHYLLARSLFHSRRKPAYTPAGGPAIHLLDLVLIFCISTKDAGNKAFIIAANCFPEGGHARAI